MDRTASLWTTHTEQLHLTPDGGRIGLEVLIARASPRTGHAYAGHHWTRQRSPPRRPRAGSRWNCRPAAGGTLHAAEALTELGTGLYISDLHYLNYSDRQACRMTGMTRFACFWVENGRLVAPISVMRFDDALPRMFGSGLIALTQAPELVHDSVTYEERHLRSVTAPGALVEGFRFTL